MPRRCRSRSVSIVRGVEGVRPLIRRSLPTQEAPKRHLPPETRSSLPGPKVCLHVSDTLLLGYRSRATQVYLEALRGVNSSLDTVSFVEADPGRYDAAVLWSHGIEGAACALDLADRAHHAARTLLGAGVPFMSAVPTALGHAACYAAWLSAGICCPLYAFPEQAWQSLGNPVVIRRAEKLSQGREMHLATSEDSAKTILRGNPRLDLVVEFVDTQGPDGLYRKYRSYIVGSRVVHRQATLSKSWKVSLESCETGEQAIAENAEFLRNGIGPDGEAVLLSAARAVGVDLGAVDYSFDREGRVVVWEINACYGMAGGGSARRDELYRAATGFTQEQVLEHEQQLGSVFAGEIIGLLSKNARRVLWTGGLDSTFRLCELLRSGESVQPVYVASRIDARRNTEKELSAIRSLTVILRETFAKGTLLDPVYIGDVEGPAVSAAIPGDSCVRAAAGRIGYGNVGNEAMGRQYEALCRLSKHFGTMEACVEIGGRAERLLRDHVEPDGAGSWRLKDWGIPRDLLIFRHMTYPLIRMTKDAMLKVAQEAGYSDILKRTWTCWMPKNGQPCGKCEMCRRRVLPCM